MQVRHDTIRVAIYLLTAYAKADREDLTPADTRALSRMVAAIKKEATRQ